MPLPSVHSFLSVRCGKKTATPYLRENIGLLALNGWADKTVVDLGCGNGRNSKFMKSWGFGKVVSLDGKADYGEEHFLGRESLPLPNQSVDVILANYSLMFLSDAEIDFLMGEIKRVARPTCHLMVELYESKNSHTPTQELKEQRLFYILDRLPLGAWKRLKLARKGGKFIAQKS